MSSGGRGSDEAVPLASGDSRESLGVPLLNEVAAAAGVGTGTRTAAASKQTGDALALFDDGPALSKRRPNAAEARMKSRRCPTCGGVVPVGMSLCSRCGLDLETGIRAALEDDLAPVPTSRADGLPLPIAIIGGICLLASVILTVAAAALWLSGSEGYQYFVPLCLFGVFASVQFLRRKSARLLLMALTFGLMIDIVALIALPIYRANAEIEPVRVSVPEDGVGELGVVLPSAVERLDVQKLEIGLGLIAVYAGVGVYLLSPQARRAFRS